MKQIAKYFDTIKKAERYLEKLYGMYDYVHLISWPYSEAGTYVFQVK
jgi:hypothetical protein